MVKAKGELIHLVRTASGEIEIDSTGKKTGRGAYLCPVWQCWETGVKSNRLERAIRGSLTESNREHLIENARGLLKELNSGQDN